MKKLILILFYLSTYSCLMAQESDIPVQGRVISMADSLPLPGASVTIKGTLTGTITDREGRFALNVPEGAVLVISYIGYTAREVPVNAATSLTIALEEDYLTLGEIEVYSTGYQELPAERATGSFEQVDNELLNRSTGTDVISRLEGVTNSLFFDRGRRDKVPGETSTSLRIRGMSTLYGSIFSGTASDKGSPLIVVDNFPYQGDISTINPNDIQNITILKDAAAASIWGARAGNGVIVINTHKGRFNKPLKVSLNSNITFREKPDLYYSPEFLPAEQFIRAERDFFENGFYSADESAGNHPALSPAVEIFIQERDGILSPAEADAALENLSGKDIREDMKKHLYRPAINQQYAINFSGGSDKLNYYFSGGYDKNLSTVKGDENSRLTFNTHNTFRPNRKIELTFGMYFTEQKQQDNGIGINELKHYTNNILPYAQLADGSGNPLPITYQYRNSYIVDAGHQGLLDWQYRPLEESNLRDDETVSRENRITMAMKYRVFNGLDLDVKYQMQHKHGERNIFRDKDSYQVRDLVNRFTQNDGTMIFPYGGMLRQDDSSILGHSGRAQINYSKEINEKHQITALAGMEVRDITQRGHASELYGYDPDILTYPKLFDFTTYYPVRPQYSARIPTPYSNKEYYTDRFVSYYGNASYTFDQRYIFSGSVRRDASNLFGVKTNQKAVPLWSAGGAWVANREAFYKSLWLPLLKVRITYGYNGNIDKSATAFTTARYSTDYYTDMVNARIETPGNPDLRWEKIRTVNVGVDFTLKDNWLSGKFEYYQKKSTDLLAPLPLDPTTGFIGTYTVNYASISTKGMDVELNTSNKIGEVSWQTTALFSYVKDEVIDFDWDGEGSRGRYFQDATLPVVGRPLYTLYSFPWIGLDPTTGDPLVNVEGQTNTDYSNYLSQLVPKDNLVAHGPKVPPYFGALRNTFIWKRFSISANITWKAGYYFRRSALNYYDLYNRWQGHSEFSMRWQQSGDELATNVPSIPTASLNSNRELIYSNSELTVEKGDHIRLQDINLSYEIFRKNQKKFPVEHVRLYIYASNLGLLWRANDLGLDPDYSLSYYTPQRSYSIGVQVDF